MPRRCPVRLFLPVKSMFRLWQVQKWVCSYPHQCSVLKHENMQYLSGAAVSLAPWKDALCTETGAQLHKLVAATVFKVRKASVP